ncbi:cytochrome c biogenesis protein DipZ [Candidatus Gottesmanbacteria bacterium]|nr:cytochrome c biogenesis protein DipZ [Candidatus Gottesmanbacteria bacterium]
MIILLIFAFLSGLVTILAPCIWPLLPIILSSSATGGREKSFGITLGIMISFAIFTLTISYLVSLFNIDPDFLRLFAVIVIGFLGLSLVIPRLSGVLEVWVSKISSKINPTSSQPRSGFWGGLITGVSLGIVWTPCAGPILATIATLSATQAVNLSLVLVTIVYVTGIGIPLFFFSYGGSLLITKSRILSPYLGRIQQIFGIIIIATALAIFTNYDKVLQAKLLDSVPAYADFLVKLESNQEVKKQLDVLKGKKETDDMTGKALNPISEMGQNLLPKYGQAPEFVGIVKWLNLPEGNLPAGRQEESLTMSQLKGKVVLIDFWTYTCINCIRTLPYVTSWYEKYKDDGLIVVGVHTPEFEFEKKTENVENAIRQYKITYPVAQDNDYKTWDAYSNRYWPAKYLIDKDGILRYYHFGEGKYEETEEAIRTLLKDLGKDIEKPMLDLTDETPKTRNTPESYLGSKRMEFYYPGRFLNNGKHNLTLPENLPENTFSFGGDWTIKDEYAYAGKNAVLELNFNANKVFLVIRPSESQKNSTMKVLFDGKVVDKNNAGVDVKVGIVTIDSDRLYNLVDLKGSPSRHILRLEFQTEGISIYAFTFG